MGIFTKKVQLPDDATIAEFWKWFRGFREELAKVFVREEDLDEGHLVSVFERIGERINKITAESRKEMEYEFGCLEEGGWDFVIYCMGSAYLRSCAERISELMPEDLRETWQITIVK